MNIRRLHFGRVTDLKLDEAIVWKIAKNFMACPPKVLA